MDNLDKMSDGQRRTLRRLAHIHGYRSIHHAAESVLGQSKRRLKRRGYTGVEAAAMIRSLAPGTSLSGATGYGSPLKTWIGIVIVVGFVAYLLSTTMWWMWFVIVSCGLVAPYLLYKYVRKELRNRFWWMSGRSRRERYYDSDRDV